MEDTEILNNHYLYKQRMSVLEKHLGSAFYKTGELHSKIYDAILEIIKASQFKPPVVQKIAEVVKPFAMAFDDLKATRLHPEDDEFQKFEDGNLIIPTKGLNSGHFRKIWELYNQLSNFPA